jgi:hypothetical protein
MKRLIRSAALVAALVIAAAGLVSPTAAAQARSASRCTRIIAVCGFTEPSGRGELVLIFEDEIVLNTPIRSAMNNTPDFWCFYSRPGFSGQSREVSRGETDMDFGFLVRSARSERCTWQ